ncbi:MAG: branched-chain amino acid ABC transporter permease [Oscillospiraceae bacterium]|nr:branched-chain amino acid ABC transporter permease [Oscillospiraceae bacterium]
MSKISALSKGQKTKLIVLAAALVLLLAVPAVLDLGVSTMSILITVLLYMYYASAWNIMGGYTGLFSLGSGIYIGLGAYITAVLYCELGISPWAGILISGLVTGLLSMLIGYPTFKLQSIYYSFATFAILLAMLTVFKNFKTVGGLKLGGAEGYKIPSGYSPMNMQFTDKLSYYYIILALLVLVLLASWFLSHSRDGYYFRAISANKDAAASLGVNVIGMKLRAQFISAFFFAVGGGFYCMFMNYIDPSKLFGNDLSINIMVMCVVGGANTLWGPVVGAGLMYTVNRVVTIYASSVSGLANIVFGVVLMLVVLFMPGGLLPFFQARLEQRKAQKELKGGGQG